MCQYRKNSEFFCESFPFRILSMVILYIRFLISRSSNDDHLFSWRNRERITKRFAIWRKISIFARRWITFRFFFFVFPHTSTFIFLHCFAFSYSDSSLSICLSSSVCYSFIFFTTKLFCFSPATTRIDIRAESAKKKKKGGESTGKPTIALFYTKLDSRTVNGTCIDGMKIWAWMKMPWTKSFTFLD